MVGSLIEKQLTTPQQYPLTMNSLLLACNQSSNRDPVVDFDERTVDGALASLKTAGIVRFVHPSHGRSVTRYRQVLEERLGLDSTELALVGVLLLRGPQTAGELRSRTERMADFDGIAVVDAELDRLAGRPEPLARKLPRRPGQKEERWVQLLAGAGAVAGAVAGDEPRSVSEREDKSDMTRVSALSIRRALRGRPRDGWRLSRTRSLSCAPRSNGCELISMISGRS